MSNLTTYKQLVKPISNEKYDIEVFNNNADIIDTELHSLDVKNTEQDNKLLSMQENVNNHKNNKENPHEVTASQLGLGKVENKSSEDIRNEIIKENITNALEYTPYSPEEVDNKISDLSNNVNNAIMQSENALTKSQENYSKIENLNTKIENLQNGCGNSKLSIPLPLETISFENRLYDNTYFNTDKGKITGAFIKINYINENGVYNVSLNFPVIPIYDDYYGSSDIMSESLVYFNQSDWKLSLNASIDDNGLRFSKSSIRKLGNTTSTAVLSLKGEILLIGIPNDIND